MYSSNIHLPVAAHTVKVLRIMGEHFCSTVIWWLVVKLHTALIQATCLLLLLRKIDREGSMTHIIINI